MSQEEDDKLDALWRRASVEDAERPAAKTRAAILAEAAAAARRREPAANAPRYWMRMVAGVAVVGIGLVLWRQTDVRLPGEMTVAEPMMQEVAPAADAVAPVTDAAAPAPEAVGELQQATAPPAESASVAPSPSTQAFIDETPKQAAQAPQREQGGEGMREDLKMAQERARSATTADRGAPAPAAPAIQSAIPMSVAEAPDGAALLREHFPVQHSSEQTHRLWVVLDGTGKVVLTGELAEDARLEDLAPRIRRETGREPTTWRIDSLVNQQDRRIEMGIMQLAR